MQRVKLDDCRLISLKELCNTKYKEQVVSLRASSSIMLYSIWKSEGKYYKVLL